MDSFTPENKSFREIIGNGKIYKVPPFQRDYSWEEEQWEELWYDIEALLKPNTEDSTHYLGYLVLKKSSIREFDIVDGQQRITTLIILILACLEQLEKQQTDDDKLLVKHVKDTYIGNFDVETVRTRPKLQLNRTNKSYYEKYLSCLNGYDSPQHESDKKLLKAFKFFKSHIEKSDHSKNGKNLAKFIDEISDKLIFTVMTVEDESKAFKLFETLNARGVELSSVDLLKNYLFSIAGEKVDTIEGDWNTVVDSVTGKEVGQLVRYYWNSRYDLVRKKRLFKAIKTNICSTTDATYFIRELEKVATVYEQIQRPESSYWGESFSLIEELRLFGVTQPYPALFAAKEVLDEQNFQKFLRIINIITFRYSKICGLNPNELELFYNGLALKLRRKELGIIKDIKEFVKNSNVYPNDKRLIGSLEEKLFTPKNRQQEKLAKYILAKIEKDMSSGFSLDWRDSNTSLEHILPKNPKFDEWGDFTENDLKAVSRLGNLCLLPTKLNNEISNSLSAKKEAFQSSQCQHVKQAIAADLDYWGYDEISARTTSLAKQVARIWSLKTL